MAVFVSYARLDEPHAERVAAGLRAKGYEVWRDDELPAHRAFSEVIEERLRDATAVVVLWSASAAKSEWVRAEADTARNSPSSPSELDGLAPASVNQTTALTWRLGWNSDTADGASSASVTPVGRRQRREQSHPAAREVSVCVLPFLNMRGI